VCYTCGMNQAEEPQQPNSGSAESWDQRYSVEQVWSGNANDTLIAEVIELEPGRALDVGCGEGADSVWLAQRGWQVTALDISPIAVEQTRFGKSHD
jgi:2-polyprenyl-3-methyl-5-hydroxy-6-metoxy-1,4-benzoquinol methylase